MSRIRPTFCHINILRHMGIQDPPSHIRQHEHDFNNLCIIALTFFWLLTTALFSANKVRPIVSQTRTAKKPQLLSVGISWRHPVVYIRHVVAFVYQGVFSGVKNTSMERKERGEGPCCQTDGSIGCCWTGCKLKTCHNLTVLCNMR